MSEQLKGTPTALIEAIESPTDPRCIYVGTVSIKNEGEDRDQLVVMTTVRKGKDDRKRSPYPMILGFVERSIAQQLKIGDELLINLDTFKETHEEDGRVVFGRGVLNVRQKDGRYTVVFLPTEEYAKETLLKYKKLTGDLLHETEDEVKEQHVALDINIQSITREHYNRLFGLRTDAPWTP